MRGFYAQRVEACVCRKLDSAISVMKAAENRAGCDGADALDHPIDGTVMAQCPMGPHAVIVCGVLVKDSAQVRFSERDQVVDAFPSDRAD
jgi:hypothetical protein